MMSTRIIKTMSHTTPDAAAIEARKFPARIGLAFLASLAIGAMTPVVHADVIYNFGADDNNGNTVSGTVTTDGTSGLLSQVGQSFDLTVHLNSGISYALSGTIIGSTQTSQGDPLDSLYASPPGIGWIANVSLSDASNYITYFIDDATRNELDMEYLIRPRTTGTLIYKLFGVYSASTSTWHFSDSTNPDLLSPSAAPPAVPAPPTLALSLLGLGALRLVRRRSCVKKGNAVKPSTIPA